MGLGKGTGSGRPKKLTEQRASGTGYDIKTMSGKAAVNHLKYSIKAKDGTYEIDTNKIREIVKEYTSTKENINRVGLRRALDISRDTYLMWLKGYVSRNDEEDENVKVNSQLTDAMRAGDDAILESLITSDDKYSQTKNIRLLESYGELMPQKQINEINANINLGKFGKWSK